MFVLDVNDEQLTTTAPDSPVVLVLDVNHDQPTTTACPITEQYLDPPEPEEPHPLPSTPAQTPTIPSGRFAERFYCPHCNVKYTKPKYLKTHLKLCGLTFRCDYCLRDYKQKRTWVLHMRTKHFVDWRSIADAGRGNGSDGCDETDGCGEEDEEGDDDDGAREMQEEFLEA